MTAGSDASPIGDYQRNFGNIPMSHQEDIIDGKSKQSHMTDGDPNKLNSIGTM